MNARHLARIEATTAGFLTAAVVVLHVNHLRHGGALWRDEVGALNVARLPTLADVFAAFPHEAFPLLFSLIVRGYTALVGAGDFAVRCFGLIVGLFQISSWWLAARWIGRGAPVLTVGLVGLNAGVLLFGDSLRGYGLATGLCVLTVGLVFRVLAKPTRGSLIALFLVALAAAHTLFIASALLLAIGLAAAAVAWGRGDRRLGLEILGGGAVIAATLLVYLPSLLAARDWDVVVRTPLPHIIFSAGTRAAIAPGPLALGWGWLGSLILASIAWAVERRRARSIQDREAARNAALALTTVLAVLTTALFLVSLRYDPRPWYFLPLLAVGALAIDSLIRGPVPAGEGEESAEVPELGRTMLIVRLIRVAGALVLTVLLWPSLLNASTLRYTNIDALSHILMESAEGQDLILVNPWYCGVSFAHYYLGAAPWETLPPIADHRYHRYDLLKARMATEHPLDALLAELDSTLRHGHKVWLVGGLRMSKSDAVLRLPPAPHSKFGWSDIPYEVSWSREVGAYLQARAVTWQGIRLEGGDPINPYERLPLLVASGYRESSGSTP